MGSIQKHIKAHGLLSDNPKEGQLVGKIRSDFARISKLSDDKVALAERGVRLLDKHVQKLEAEFERLKDMGYNVGDLLGPSSNSNSAAGASGAAPNAAANQPFPVLAGASEGGSVTKKRKLAPVNAGLQLHGTPGMGGFGGAGTPTSAQQMQQGNPFAASPSHAHNQMGTPTQGSQLTPQQQQQMYQAALAQSSGAGLPYGPSAGQQYLNSSPNGIQQQFTLQQQQQMQQFQNAYSNIGQLAGGGGAGGSNASRPHRPSRLSTSFSASGAGPHTLILPSTSAAHLPPGAQTPTGADGSASTGLVASGSGTSLSGLGNSTGGGAGTKRGRPAGGPASATSATGPGGSAAGGPKKANKKKRIQISDEESIGSAVDGVTRSMTDGGDFDAEGEDDDGDGDESVMTVASSLPGQKRGPGGQKGASSRAGTPLGHSVGSQAGTGGTGGAQKIRPSGAGGQKQTKAQLLQQQQQLQLQQHYMQQQQQQQLQGGYASPQYQQLLQAGMSGRLGQAGGDEDADGEEEVDAEGEEDWTHEGEELNADDPSLYCFCQRVSYGNVRCCAACSRLESAVSADTFLHDASRQMIACDNDDCKYEWFHWACVRITKQPDENQQWFCPDCRPLMQGPASSGGSNSNSNSTGTKAPASAGAGGTKALMSSTSASGGAGAGAGPYAELQAQQREMMLAAAAAGGGGRASRRG